jgi:hypothetical protein
MSDTLKTIRNVSLVGFAIVFLVCAGGLIMYRTELAGALHLNTAHTQMIETLAREEPGSVFEIVDVTPRSAALVIGVHSPDLTDDETRRLQDAVWGAYVDAFGNQGFAVSHVAVAAVEEDGSLSSERLGSVDIATLADRTGRGAPALHPMYAGQDYFDPATEAPPVLEEPVR